MIDLYHGGSTAFKPPADHQNWWVSLRSTSSYDIPPGM
jgi:hypothetical protein